MANATAARPRRTAAKGITPEVFEPATPAQLRALTQEIKDDVLVEREKEMDALLLAALASVNLHMQGPPGTAKSRGARAFCERIGINDERMRHFEKTIHPQMPADALIGTYDMEKLLKESKFERKVAGYLPDADSALLDEITRANGPVTDALLPLMNTRERMYEANGSMLKAPMLFLVTTSNFMPDPNDPLLGAFVDRFTLMVRVEYIKADESFKEMLRRSQARRRGEPRAKASVHIALESFKAAQEAARQVDATDPDYLQHFAELRRATRNAGLAVSDRRWDELADVANAAAFMAGRNVAQKEDLAALESGLWRVFAEIPTAREVIKPYLSTFERDAAEKRREAQDALDTHERLQPVVEATPPTEPVDREVNQELADKGRTLKHVYLRVKESIAQAERQHSDCPSLRQLLAELEGWRQWRDQYDLPANWDR